MRVKILSDYKLPKLEKKINTFIDKIETSASIVDIRIVSDSLLYVATIVYKEQGYLNEKRSS